jgi:hypothetical protein
MHMALLMVIFTYDAFVPLQITSAGVRFDSPWEKMALKNIAVLREIPLPLSSDIVY